MIRGFNGGLLARRVPTRAALLCGTTHTLFLQSISWAWLALLGAHAMMQVRACDGASGPPLALFNLFRDGSSQIAEWTLIYPRLADLHVVFV